MFEKLRKFKLNKTIAKHNREAKFMSYDDINKVLLLFESDLEENNSGVKDIIKRLKEEEKEVDTCCYIDKKELTGDMGTRFTTITEKDTDFFGRPKKENIDDIIGKEYDAVIDLTLNNCIPLVYVLLKVKTQFRCGKHKQEGKLYDFEIELPETEAYPLGKKLNDCGEEKILGEQIIKYLNQVKSI